jgi:diaminopimelate epimerase
MKIEFVKYHGTGNDFILINGMDPEFPKQAFTQYFVAGLCHRRFGIGADGLIILLPDEDSDFYMWYFNSDGKPSSMCGNGSRCALHLAHELELISDQATFKAADGLHRGHVYEQSISVLMNTGVAVERAGGDFVINTGSPHYIRFVPNISEIDVTSNGRAIRMGKDFLDQGINVNFVEVIASETIKVATYERGVEDETYSCGTGVTASALIQLIKTSNVVGDINVITKGGELNVRVSKNAKGQTEVWLMGPAVPVYKGSLNISVES